MHIHTSVTPSICITIHIQSKEAWLIIYMFNTSSLLLSSLFLLFHANSEELINCLMLLYMDANIRIFYLCFRGKELESYTTVQHYLIIQLTLFSQTLLVSTNIKLSSFLLYIFMRFFYILF